MLLGFGAMIGYPLGPVWRKRISPSFWLGIAGGCAILPDESAFFLDSEYWAKVPMMGICFLLMPDLVGFELAFNK